jgi:class 3 adenylate cyclase
VLAQKIVDAGATHTFAAPRTPGRYRAFARGGAIGTLEVKEGLSAAPVKVTLTEDAFGPSHVVIGPGAELVITNATAEPRHLKLERLAFASAAATAYAISNVPEFRRFFSKELLKPKTPMKVSRVTLLFSDLTGSTALYSAVGDAAAFRFVDDHFDVVQGALEPNGGVLVKTMGDAVMASFLEPSAGLHACHAALVAFDAFRKGTAHADLVGLKLGLYTGPCYVITANERLDYFGQTVNLAARLQALAESGELVMEKGEFEALSDADRALFRVTQAFEKVVKGIETPIQVLRLTPA